MTVLVRMLREHADAVEADLILASSSIDLLDLWRPESGLTLRRLYAVLKALPPSGAFKTALRRAEADALTSAERQRERAAKYAGGAPA